MNIVLSSVLCSTIPLSFPLLYKDTKNAYYKKVNKRIFSVILLVNPPFKLQVSTFNYSWGIDEMTYL